MPNQYEFFLLLLLVIFNFRCTLQSLEELPKILLSELFLQRFGFHWSRVWPGHGHGDFQKLSQVNQSTAKVENHLAWLNHPGSRRELIRDAIIVLLITLGRVIRTGESGNCWCSHLPLRASVSSLGRASSGWRKGQTSGFNLRKNIVWGKPIL